MIFGQHQIALFLRLFLFEMARIARPLPLLEASSSPHYFSTKRSQRASPTPVLGNSLSCSSTDRNAAEELDCTPLQLQQLQHHEEGSVLSLRLTLPTGEPISLDRICYTWQAVASQNPSLRTTIVARGVGPHYTYQQVIHKRASFLHFGLEGTDTKTFYCDQPAYLSASLQNDTIEVCLRIHRALVDYTSLAHIRKDFALFYNGLAMDEHRSFSSYVDHVNKKDAAAAKGYWKNTLADVVTAPIHSIPLHRDSSRTSTVTNIDGKLLESIQWLREEFSISMRGLLHAAWALTLARHTGSSDNHVTFLVVGRDMTFAGYQTLVGAVDQTYPLKVHLPPKTPAWKWIRMVEDADLDASANAFIGLKDICGCSSPGSFDPQTIVTIAEAFEQCTNVEESNEAPLSLSINTSSIPAITMYHNEAILESKIHVLLEHFLTALSNIANNPFSTVEEIDVVSSAERRFLLEHGQPVTEAVEGLVNKLFEQQVESTPDAAALQLENDDPLTYSQLNKLANKVARQLRCGRGSYVPVCMHRSAELIVALLAILKSGAAYTTLDPEVPLERNRFIVEDLKAPFVIIDKSSSGTFENEITIESLVESARDEDDTNFSVYQEPRDIVYVIYTSGSTGKPKGVLLEHTAAYSGLAAFPVLPRLRQLLFQTGSSAGFMSSPATVIRRSVGTVPGVMREAVEGVTSIVLICI